MNQKIFTRRVYITGLLFAVLSLVFIIRLFNLHFSDRITVSNGKKILCHRGSIRDRNGFLLAISIEKNSLFVNPAEITNPEETAKTLSRYLQMPADSILKRLMKNKIGRAHV